MAKTITARVQHKYDTIEKWKSVEDSFIPLEGEFIIYAPGTDNGIAYGVRQKIGDGTSTLCMLPFVTSPEAEKVVLSIQDGGTGATTAEQARSNLEITPANIGAVPSSRTVNGKSLSSNVTITASDIEAAPAYTVSTVDLTAGTSSLESGKLYFVYE